MVNMVSIKSLEYKNFINNAISFSLESEKGKCRDTEVLEESEFVNLEYKSENFNKVKVGVHYAIAIYGRAISNKGDFINDSQFEAIDNYFNEAISAQNLDQIDKVMEECTEFISKLTEA